jgi:hypothetical protein
MSCPNFKNGPKTGLLPLEVKQKAIHYDPPPINIFKNQIQLQVVFSTIQLNANNLHAF